MNVCDVMKINRICMFVPSSEVFSRIPLYNHWFFLLRGILHLVNSLHERWLCTVTLPKLTSGCKDPRVLTELPQIGFGGNTSMHNCPKCPFFVCNIFKIVCLQNRITVDILMLVMCSASWLQAW